MPIDELPSSSVSEKSDSDVSLTMDFNITITTLMLSSRRQIHSFLNVNEEHYLPPNTPASLRQRSENFRLTRGEGGDREVSDRTGRMCLTSELESQNKEKDRK